MTNYRHIEKGIEEMADRPWRLELSGTRSPEISTNVKKDLADLLDLLPSVGQIVIELDQERVVASRAWPSDHMDLVEALFQRVSTADGIFAISADETRSANGCGKVLKTTRGVPWRRARPSRI